MQRRTPIIAILLAPVVLYASLLLWKLAIVPLKFAIMKSETVVQYRLTSDNPETRTRALQATISKPPVNESLLQSVVRIMQTDKVPEVRAAAAYTLGKIGFEQALPKAAKQALMGGVLSSEDEAVHLAAVKALGQSARKNQYPDSIVLHLAAAIVEPDRPLADYAASIEALGKMVHAQTLPDSVLSDLHTVFVSKERQDLRELLTGMYVNIAASQSLPLATMDTLADTVNNTGNLNIRSKAILALAHASPDYPPAIALINQVAQNETGKVPKSLQRTAQNALKLMEETQGIKTRNPMSLALDPAQPVKSRLAAIRRVRSQAIKPEVYEQVLSLARDFDPQVKAAGIELFQYMASSPKDDFDKHVLLPELKTAMSDKDPLVRVAAFSALSKIFVGRSGYRRRADTFQIQIDAGKNDADARVRVAAMAAQLRSKPGVKERDAILEWALNDRDPYVRSSVTGWIGYPKSKSKHRQALFAKALKDPDESVRKAARRAQQSWQSREGQGLKKLTHALKSGDYGAFGMGVLTIVTVAAPVVIGGIFLLYYVARLLTYLGQKRWQALAVVPVIMLWTGASYGMFFLYFLAGHAGNSDTSEMLQLAGLLWIAILVYATFGWGLHYFIRR